MMTRLTTRQRTRRRGTATVEFAMTIPLLGLVLSLTFFFGWELTNKEHLRMSDRWAVWRTVRGADDSNTQMLNDTFFKDKATNVNMNLCDRCGPQNTLQSLVQQAGTVSPGAGQWAQELVIDRFPWACSAQVSAEFPSPSAAWKGAGAIHSAHTRDGFEWRRNQARCEEALQQDFLSNLDGTLSTVPAPGDTLANVFQRLYLSGW